MPLVCQSCCVPLRVDADRGRNLDDSLSAEYCHYCFEGGAFADSVGVNTMIRIAASQLEQRGTPAPEALSLAQSRVPRLNRWRPVANRQEAS